MNWFRNFMMGRNGGDHLNMALLVVPIILNFIPVMPVRILSFAILGVALFRMFSKNLSKRRMENEVFLRFWFKIINWFKNIKVRQQESKSFRRFRCPSCSQQVRVPRNKGKISIKCPKCGTKFIKKV